MMIEPNVFLNDRMLPASQAHINIYDAGIVLGASVAEMARTFGHKVFRLEDHLLRLARSLRYVRFDIGMSMDELGEVVHQLAEHNAGLLQPTEELGIVIFVTAGENRIYAGSAGGGARQKPTVCVHSFPLPFHLFSEKMRSGVHLVTPSIRHVPPQCFDPNMKYRSRMHYYLADQEVRLVSPEAVALLLDMDGNVTETSGANFLIVDSGAIVSPTLRNILPGISRAVVIELAEKLGIPFVERDFKVFNAVNAEEAFLTTTPYCMMPVARINGIPVGSGKPGPIYRRLLAAWSAEVGLDIEMQIIDAAKPG